MDDRRNGNNGQWDRWDSNASNSSYYNQPTHRPYGQAFSTASAVCGLLAMATGCTVVLSLPLGSLGILFAVLARRSKKKMSNTCFAGLALSCAGLAAAVTMLVYSFAMLPSLMKDEGFRSQLDGVTRQLYGIDFSEFMKETYGYTFE